HAAYVCFWPVLWFLVLLATVDDGRLPFPCTTDAISNIFLRVVWRTTRTSSYYGLMVGSGGCWCCIGVVVMWW
ncbi:hypothetical protein A2U01_0048933, partial [Trifolium medium]|nr:hypothetical protein [Trifolium medium]